VPYVAQRSQNTWVGIIVHAGLNGSAFLMLAFGLA
jgi:membrane protease YdiL (CAAX protease family)